MANIIIPKPWMRRDLRPAEEKIYRQRRKFLKELGILTVGATTGPLLMSMAGGGFTDGDKKSFHFEGEEKFYPAKRKETFTLDRPLTAEYDATHYNNFYEFIRMDDPNIYNAYKYVEDFDTSDWKIRVSGLAKKKGKYHLGDLIREMGTEERTYRFRCVERWSMAVPWVGFPLAKLLKFFEPEETATHVRFISASNPSQMPGILQQHWYPWPYFEALRMDEAMNELAFVATGIYGKPLPKQNGAPIRIVVPWKYGYKNPKSIVKIEFVSEEPETFWHQTNPKEYGFVSNVDPGKPHPRWSQAIERMIPDGEPRPTLKYNGYGEFVAKLYE